MIFDRKTCCFYCFLLVEKKFSRNPSCIRYDKQIVIFRHDARRETRLDLSVILMSSK